MERWAWSVPLLFVALAFAGCLGGGEEVTAADEEATNDTGASAAESMPDGREGKLIAFEETNVTEEGEGGVDHRHDYWQGRERVTIAEQNVRMMQWAGATEAVGEVVLAADALVYEGAAKVEMTFSAPKRRACETVVTFNGDFVCTDFATGTRVDDPSGGPAGFKVSLRHAATTTWIEVGEIAWGETMVFDITDAKMTDMPHATNTLWGFRVTSTEPDAHTVTFDSVIDIIRAPGEIPLWPGHPEFYALGPERVVLDAEGVTRETGLSGAAGASGQSSMEKVVPEKLISYGTKAIVVTVDIQSLEQLNPAEAPSGWFLQYHNASGRWLSTDWTDPEHPGDATAHTWVLPVDDGGMDSPYGDGSRWGFRLRASFDGGVVACSGCAAYEAQYAIRVVATNVDLLGESAG